MKLQRFVLVVMTIAFGVSTATPAWAAETVKPAKSSIVETQKPPKLQRTIKPLPAKARELKPPVSTISPAPRPGGAMEPRILEADLQFGVISVTPQNPREGQQVSLTINVMNYGEGPAYQPELIITVTGPSGVPAIPVPKKAYVTLTKNQGITFTHTFLVPKHGNYSCALVIDQSDKIAETNENNNQTTFSFPVMNSVDMIVCIDNGKRPPVFGSREIKAVVKNIGSMASNHAAELKLRFYVEGKGVNFYDLPSISPGQNHTITRNHSWSTSGTKTITAKVIYTWQDETNTQNNEVSGSYFVRLPHHDTYSADPRVKCSTNVNFYSWADCDSQY